MIDGEKVIANLQMSWEKQFSVGVVKPSTNIFCTDCDEDSLCDRCGIMANQTKEFLADLNETKREPPTKLGHMLPWYKE